MNKKISLFALLVGILLISAIAQEHDPLDPTRRENYNSADFYKNSDPSTWKKEWIQWEHVPPENIPQLRANQIKLGELNNQQLAKLTSTQVRGKITTITSTQIGKVSKDTINGLKEDDAKAYFADRFKTGKYKMQNDNERDLKAKIKVYRKVVDKSFTGYYDEEGRFIEVQRDDVYYGKEGDVYYIETAHGKVRLNSDVHVEYQEDGLQAGRIKITNGEVTVISPDRYIFTEGSEWKPLDEEYKEIGAKIIADEQTTMYFDPKETEQLAYVSVVYEKTGRLALLGDGLELTITEKHQQTPPEQRKITALYVDSLKGKIIVQGSGPDGTYVEFKEGKVSYQEGYWQDLNIDNIDILESIGPDGSPNFLFTSEGGATWDASRGCEVSALTGAAIADVTGMFGESCKVAYEKVVSIYEEGLGGLQEYLFGFYNKAIVKSTEAKGTDYGSLTNEQQNLLGPQIKIPEGEIWHLRRKGSVRPAGESDPELPLYSGGPWDPESHQYEHAVFDIAIINRDGVVEFTEVKGRTWYP